MKRLLGFLFTVASLVVGTCYTSKAVTNYRIEPKDAASKKEANNFDFRETKIVDVSAGWSHNLALDQDGGLWVWGNNEQGQLGDGTTTTSYLPKQIMKGHKFRFIEVGKGCSAAIDLNGYLYVWGETQNLIETEEILLEPTLVSDTVRYRSVHFNGWLFNTVSENDRAIKYVGLTSKKEEITRLSESETEVSYYCPRYGSANVYFTEKVLSFDSYYYNDDYHDYYTYLSLSGGRISGDFKGGIDFFKSTIFKNSLNFFENSSITATEVCFRKVEDFTGINRTTGTAFVLGTNGTVYGFGYNGGIDNYLGNEVNIVRSDTWLSVETSVKFIDIEAGNNHILAIDNNGQVYSWGNNAYGQLGVGDTTNRNLPTMIQTFTDTKTFKVNAFYEETYKGSFAQNGGSKYQVLTQGKKGTLTVDQDTGDFSYIPTTGEYGEDLAVVSINYGELTVQYDVKILIDRKPVITDGTYSFSLETGETYSGRIHAVDQDGDELTFSILEEPKNGRVVLTDSLGGFTYYAGYDNAGTDSFAIGVSDGYTTVKQTIEVYSESLIKTADETNIDLDVTNLETYYGNVQASDLDGDELSYSVSKQASKGTVSIDQEGNYEYIPTEGEYGEDTFEITINDGYKPLTVTYTVNLYSVVDNGTTVLNKIKQGEAYAGKVSVSANGATPYFSIKTLPNKGNLSINNENGDYLYTPSEDTIGSDKFTITVDYGYDSFDIEIEMYQNTPPSSTSVTKEINFKQYDSFEGSAACVDLDGDTLTYRLSSGSKIGANIIVEKETGKFNYYTYNDMAGDDNFTIAVSDGIDTIHVDFNVHIESIIKTNTQQFIKLRKGGSYSGTIVATDDDGDTLSYSLSKKPEHGMVSVASISGSYTYVPLDGYVGPDSFAIEVTDGVQPVLVNFTVSFNEAPVVQNEVLTFTTNGEVITSILGVSDADEEALTYTLLENPEQGEVYFDPETDTFAYQPFENAAGHDSFVVKVSDGLEDVRVIVNIYNETPVTIPEQETNLKANYGVTLRGKVKAQDLDGDSLRYTISENPVSGELTINSWNGEFSYTPNVRDAETDSFKIEVTDGTTTASITYSVSINQPADFSEDIETFITLEPGETYHGEVSAIDNDGDSVAYSIVSQGEKGHVEIDQLTGKFSYKADSDEAGDDSFILGASDGNYTNQLVFNVHIETALEMAISSIPTIVINQNDSCYVDLAQYVTDRDGDKLTFTINENGQIGTATINENSSTLMYVSNGEGGTDFVVVKASDGLNELLLTIPVKVKSTPTIEAGTIYAYVASKGSVSGSTLAYDKDGDQLTYGISEDPKFGSVTINKSSGEFTYTNLNEMREDSFKISVTDGVNTVYVEVIVNINEPPVASNQTFNAPQGDVYENEITAIDLDDDKLSFAVTKQGNLGNVKIDSETGKFVYTPNSKSYVAARDQFTVSISDGKARTSIVITLNITPNSLPNLDDLNLEVKQGQSVKGTLNGTDSEDNPISYKVKQQGQHGTFTVDSSGNYIYQTTDNTYYGSDMVIIELNDGYANSETTIFIDIVQNELPVATSSEVSIDVNQGSTYTGQLSVTDPENDKLVYRIHTQAEHGSARINLDSGEYTYINYGKNYYENDFFIVEISDGFNVIYVTINASITKNSAPTCDSTTINVTQNQTSSGKLAVSDRENDDVTFEIVSMPKHGDLTIDSEGNYTFISNDTDFVGTDTAIVRVRDEYGFSDVVIDININKNSKPTINNTIITVDSGASSTGSFAATDSDNDSLTYSITAQGNKGIAYVDENTGEFIYNANNNASGYDCFVLTISDGVNTSSYLIEVNINFADTNVSWAMPLAIACGAVALIALGTLIVFVLRNKKKA